MTEPSPVPGPVPEPPHQPPVYGAIAPSIIEENKDARTMGMLCHLLGIPLGFLGPLIIWMIKKDEMPFVNDQGKESLNFQLTLLIAYVVSVVIAMVTCGLGAPLIFIPMVLQIVFCIIGTIKANNGEYYRYPMTIRMVK